MRHVQANLDLLYGVLVAAVGVLKLEDQLTECTKTQGLVHQVSAPAHTQRTVATIAVDTQHNMVKVVAGELCFKANGETLQWGQAIG